MVNGPLLSVRPWGMHCPLGLTLSLLTYRMREPLSHSCDLHSPMGPQRQGASTSTRNPTVNFKGSALTFQNNQKCKAPGTRGNVQKTLVRGYILPLNIHAVWCSKELKWSNLNRTDRAVTQQSRLYLELFLVSPFSKRSIIPSLMETF